LPVPPQEPAPTTLRSLIEGYRVTQALYVAATLGIADLLAGGSRTSDELAAATGAHPPTLYRLLRALASVDVLRELDGRRFELAPLGQPLRSDAPNSVAGLAAYVGRPYYWQAWGGLEHSVRTGENAFRHAYGTDLWAYRAERPEESAIFDRAMTSNSRRAVAALLAAYDFGRFHTIVDVGGGNGALLAAILAAHPALQGVLFDQPHVVAHAPELLAAAGVDGRCQVIAGSFFETVPAGADAYVLRNIIHDWEDEDCQRILAVVRRAIPAAGTLLILERTLGLPNEGREAKFSDLNMLVAPGGRERTEAEFAALLAAAGFRLARVVEADGSAVLEGLPV
jgi:hypothetical protein